MTVKNVTFGQNMFEVQIVLLGPYEQTAGMDINIPISTRIFKKKIAPKFFFIASLIFPKKRLGI